MFALNSSTTDRHGQILNYESPILFLTKFFTALNYIILGIYQLFYYKRWWCQSVKNGPKKVIYLKMSQRKRRNDVFEPDFETLENFARLHL